MNPFRSLFPSRFARREPFLKAAPEPPINLNPLNQPTIPTTPNGWIFCKDGQPDFDTQVEVLALAVEPSTGADDVFALGLGRRTREAHQTASGNFQESWHCVFLKRNTGKIVAWRPAPSERL